MPLPNNSSGVLEPGVIAWGHDILDDLLYRRTPARLVYSDSKGIEHFYFPDFRVRHADGTVALEEIKPEALLEYKNNGLKLTALRLYCKRRGYSCRVITSLKACKERT